MEAQGCQTGKPRRRRLDVPARYVFASVRLLSSVLHSLQSGCLSLAITSMVGAPPAAASSSGASGNATATSSASPDVCPVPEHTNTTVATTERRGEFDWNELTQSYVMNSATYGTLCMILVGVDLAHRWSPKMLLACSAAQSLLCTLLTPVLARWNVYVLIAARALHGLMSGATVAASAQLEASWFPPEERQQLCGIISGVSHIGSITSSAVTGVLIETFGWEFPFYLYGGLSTLPLILWMFFIFDTPEAHPRISEEEKHYITTRIKKINDVKLPVPWLQIALSSPVWAYLSVSVSITWLSYIFMTELPTYLKRVLHYTTSQAGYVTSLATVAISLSQLSSGFFSQWLRRNGYVSHLTSYRIFNALATLGPTVTLIIITQVSCNATIIVAMLLLTNFLHGAYISGSQLNHMDLAINFVTALVGIGGTITSIVGIISPTLAAALINNNQTLSAWSKVFYISAVVSAVPYIIFLIFGSVDEQPWNTPEIEIGKKASKETEDSESQTSKERRENRGRKVNIC